MSTVVKSQPVVNRTVKMVEPFTEGTAVIEIKVLTVGKRSQKVESFEYFVDKLPGDVGEHFCFTKRIYSGEPDHIYHVWIANEQDAQCECPAHEYRGRCRHVDALRALRARGQV